MLLPAVREAAADTLVLADGFSCRTQIEQGTGRHGRHLAEVLAEPWRLRREEEHGERDGQGAPGGRRGGEPGRGDP